MAQGKGVYTWCTPVHIRYTSFDPHRFSTVLLHQDFSVYPASTSLASNYRNFFRRIENIQRSDRICPLYQNESELGQFGRIACEPEVDLGPSDEFGLGGKGIFIEEGLLQKSIFSRQLFLIFRWHLTEIGQKRNEN